MVVIKGLTLPKNCAECELNSNGFCVVHDGIPAHKLNFESRPDWCPLDETDSIEKEVQ